MPAGTPGTTSNGTPAAATASASATTASAVSGSPRTRRATARPAAASASRSRATSAGLADRRPDLGAVGDERQDRLGDVGVGDDERRGGQCVPGADGQQAGIAGAAAHEGDPPGGGGRCSAHVLFELPFSGSQEARAPPRSSSSAASAAPSFSAFVDVSGGRRRAAAPPSAVPSTARSDSAVDDAHRRRPGRLTTSANAPTGALQPASSAASTRPLRGDRGAGDLVVERGGQLADEVVVVGPALHGQRALCRGGQHLQRVEQLGRLVDPAEPAQPGGRDDDRVELARARPCRCGCRRCPGSARRRARGPSARSCAVRRGEPVPTRDPGGSSPSTRPSRATSASRGSSRGGTAASTSRGSGAVGRSL